MYEDLEQYDFSKGAELPVFKEKIEIPKIDFEVKKEEEENDDEIDLGFLL